MKINPERLQKAFVITKTTLENQNLPSFLKRRWLRALEKAQVRLLEQTAFAWQPHQLTIVSAPGEKQDEINSRFYQATELECLRLDKSGFCQAFFEGFPCWHRAAFLLLGIYFGKKSEIQPGENLKGSLCRRSCQPKLTL